MYMICELLVKFQSCDFGDNYVAQITIWWAECLANLLFSRVWWKKVWRMNRSAKGLSMITTNLDGFSLANCR